jgi:hypothetical protein
VYCQRWKEVVREEKQPQTLLGELLSLARGWARVGDEEFASGETLQLRVAAEACISGLLSPFG